MSPTLYQADLRITSHRRQNSPPSFGNFIFYSLQQFFDVYRMILHQKAFFFNTVCFFKTILRCDSDFRTVFTARYFWFKSKLKQKKCIFKQLIFSSLYLRNKIGRFYILGGNHHFFFIGAGPLRRLGRGFRCCSVCETMEDFKEGYLMV